MFTKSFEDTLIFAGLSTKRCAQGVTKWVAQGAINAECPKGAQK